MNGRKRKRERRREGNMYVFFVFLFLVSNTGEDQKRKSVAGRCQPSYFIPSQRHRDTCRMSTRKMSCKGKGKRSGIRLANGSRIKMQVCQVFFLFDLHSFPISILCNHILYVLINLSSTTLLKKKPMIDLFDL